MQSENPKFILLRVAHQRAGAEAPNSFKLQVQDFLINARVVLAFAGPGASDNTIFQ